MASGDNLAVGGNLESCTSVVQLSKPFRLDGRRVILVDTPGFDDTRTKDTDVLAMIAAFLSTTQAKVLRTHWLLLTIRIGTKKERY